ncbi:uncharacterized protein LOC135712142 [Ochlerotatus camptorhynchus]|uniref:uncharacterized protein LOC135712142 n=1 Tax=Ochlerotatus camptorhynchus TaxID=644619 RepID=UPI0031DDB8DE
MLKALFLLILVIVYEGSCSSITRDDNFDGYGQNSTASQQPLSRKKRFLLFPVGASLLLTASGGKAFIVNIPGHNFILELDLYHPLPDYKMRLSSLQLGAFGMKTLKTLIPKPAPSPPTPPPHDHHNGHELSQMELQQYLKDHPDTWVPPGYGNDRSDWFQQGTYNPYKNDYKQSMTTNPSYGAQKYKPYKSYLWGNAPSNSNHPNLYRMRRSIDESVHDDTEEEEDRFNISHHRNWEHFYHYREKRDLYHSLEHAFGESYRFNMKACIMRAICEARSFLLPPGKSMMMDILRIVFSVPLKDDLQDEYSSAMREKNLDCHYLYGKDCSVSILYLVLFGKFIP